VSGVGWYLLGCVLGNALWLFIMWRKHRREMRRLRAPLRSLPVAKVRR
jgi:hypothetical protein